MNFNSESKVNEIVLSNPAVRRVLEDAGVDYCCGGGKTLHDACLHSGVTAEEVLQRLRNSSQPALPGDKQWINAPLADLTRHIRDRHHRYVRESIPRVLALLTKVCARHGAKHPEILEVEKQFAEVAAEMTSHMQKEEQVLFPYIDALEQSKNQNTPLERPFFQTVRNPVHTMMKEHDSAGELVRGIHTLTGGYQPPADACTAFRAAYQELHQFEKDLHLHVHLENNILFPRAIELEATSV